jgi:hypothetical protein
MRKSILWAFVLLFCAAVLLAPFHGVAEARTYRVNIATATTRRGLLSHRERDGPDLDEKSSMV